MYFILPIGHEESEVRRIPWVTATIAVLCVLVHLLITTPDLKKEEEMFFALEEAYSYFLEHPHLQPSPEMKKELRNFEIDIDEGRVLGQFVEEEEESGYVAPELLEADPDYEYNEGDGFEASAAIVEQRGNQAELDRLFQVYVDFKEKHGERLGLIPGDFEVFDLIASIFLHGDWWHLFGNLFFFWLCAPTLEDVWGRPFFAAFFLLAGCMSGLFWIFLNFGSMIPLVGASGAIAGLMGAFAIRFKSSRITFVYAYLWWLPPFLGKGTFALPAWLTLGFWFAREFFLMAIVEAWDVSSGVAFAAHVGGFGFGALAVFLMARNRVEERFLAPAIEKRLGEQLGGRTNVELAKAHQLIDQGRTEEAWGTLLQALDKAPNDPDSATALWDLAVRLDRREQAVPPVLRQLKLELRGGDRMLALQRWDEIRDLVLPSRLDVDLAWRLAEAQIAEGQRTEARDLLDLLPLSAVVGQQLAVKIRVLKLAAEAGSGLTLPLAEHCAALPDIPEPMKVPISTGLSRGREIEAAQRSRREQLGSIELIPFADQVRSPAPAPVPAVPVAPAGAPGQLPNLPQDIFAPLPLPVSPLPPPLPMSPLPSVPVSAPSLLPDIPADLLGPVPVSDSSQVKSYLSPPPQITTYSPPPQRSAPPVPPPLPETLPASLRILEGIPVRFHQDQLEVSEGIRTHHFPLPSLAAVAVARIDEAARPWMLIDLFLDPPAAAGARVVRLRSTRYDPRKELAPEAPDPFQAFQVFVQKLLQVSRARALPSSLAAQGQPFARFPGLSEYESAIRLL